MSSVVPDCLDRAAAHRLITERLLFLTLRLLENKRIAVLIRAREITRRRVAANVTIDARGVDVIRTANVLFDFIVFVRHA